VRLQNGKQDDADIFVGTFKYATKDTFTSTYSHSILHIICEAKWNHFRLFETEPFIEQTVKIDMYTFAGSLLISEGKKLKVILSRLMPDGMKGYRPD
jgi:hypothetical protein